MPSSLLLKITGTTGGSCTSRNLIKLRKQSEDAKAQACLTKRRFVVHGNPSIKAADRCVLSKLALTFSPVYRGCCQGEVSLSGFHRSRQFDALLLRCNPATNTSMNPQEFCFCPISSEVVSLEQMLRGCTVSVCLPPPHSSFSPSMSTSYQRSGAQAAQG